ncbi:helix-turn-helix transcriptional regulator [Actinomadura verrucosospora]|uniref:XRE family transcriptional regulator n=1 Tax=Actinomadura verrucosospora TaxID=46165 RepID=A0A7D4AQY4_ACTVE|nr:XRE family transcriptional regulator [Actinomadura verrucosospora]
MLAGVSVDYYIRLERGNLAGVSDGVLEALARALQLDDAERGHLFDLARAAGPGRRARRPAPKVRPGLQRMLDAMTDAPSIIRNGRLDILAADITVALMRTEAGRDPHDRELTGLIGELCTRSDDFRTRWARHNVRRHHAGTKTFHHPVVGDLSLDYESIDLVADGDLNLTVYTATPDSSSHDAVRLLASWAATLDDEAAARPDDAPREEPAGRSPARPRPER